MPLPKFDRPNPTVRPLNDIAVAGANMLNQQGIAEGSQVPPEQHGTYRVPTPSGFRALSVISDADGVGSLVTLSWLDVSDSSTALNKTQVAGYRIYAQRLYENDQPTNVGLASQSPAVVRVIVASQGQVTFWIQPFLSSGLTLPLEACPTCSAFIPTPALTVGRVILKGKSASASTITLNGGPLRTSAFTAPSDFAGYWNLTIGTNAHYWIPVLLNST